MNAPAYIEFLGNASGGNKISGKFPGPDYPDQVNIKGTPDTEGLRGNSGIWMSSGKYTSLGITLILKKAGQPDVEISYDANGNPKLSDADVSRFTATAANPNVNLTWTTTKEISVTAYIVDRKTSGGVYEEGVAAEFPDSRSVPKEYPDPAAGTIIADTPPAAGSYIYRLRARFENGSFKTLAESGTVTV